MKGIINIDRKKEMTLKGLAIFMVLLGHTGYLQWGGAGGVDLFLILSGYGMNCSVRNNGLKGYWGKRFQRVWLPYFFVGLIQIIIGQAKGLSQFLCTLIGIDFCRLQDKTMWFISYIILWYLVYYILESATGVIRMDKLRIGILISGLLAAAFLIRRIYYNTNVWNYPSGAGRYVLAFPLGVIFGELSRIQIKAEIKDGFWSVFILLLLAYLIRYYSENYDTLMGFAMALFPVSVSQLIPMDAKLWRPINWLGRYSYAIYLFEGILLERRQLWFEQFGSQILIDLAWLFTTCGVAFIYWELIYGGFLKIYRSESVRM